MLEPVSFTTGIQVLFYQISLSEHERLFFLFLWRGEGNLNFSIIDHEVYVCIFSEL